MSNEQENVAKLRTAYDLWHESKGDSVDHWLDLMGDRIQFHSLAAGAWGMEFTSPCSSKDEVRRYFSGLAADWSMDHFTMAEYVAQGDRVVALGRCGWTHRRSKMKVDTPKADVWRFENGKAVEFQEFFDTARALAAAR